MSSSPSSPPSVLVVMADGSEEMESVIPIDVLRRARASVIVAAVCDSGKTLTCSRGVRIEADVRLDDLLDASSTSPSFDLVIVPGGMPGASNLAASEPLRSLLLAQNSRGAWVAAICAAPAVVLAPLGIVKGRRATCHPAFAKDLESAQGGCSEDRVVVEHEAKIVTSRGPGTAMEFALECVEVLFGKETREEVAKPMVIMPAM
mmetsp:Transcript_22072/g.43429  ORF Transcript_22072/g.43429 Transcript_22072/m.43429 type:complete len:204 (-) Transcript_22072:410-1021(-)|eukprot:CAMPEP_0171543654 /NCGR_PEP_ID=MMETSP0960-20121227/3053_1 /TAXON_ID=87120 /ORGANISM="Aurantiochytrium limacinum, Strain ATCCMYA-1381" /LENGTH=203 /DNA_ID=CAMNT_0012091351 /DNA_START=18 /DNA_END=629 /DNA_ORIENTATION=+